MNQAYKQSIAYLSIKLLVDILLMTVLIGFFTFIKHLYDYICTSITLTGNGVILKRGLVTSNVTEIPYTKINSITIKQGILGQFLNYGDVIILAGNDLVGIPFKGISSPEEIKRQIYQYISNKSS